MFGGIAHVPSLAENGTCARHRSDDCESAESIMSQSATVSERPSVTLSERAASRIAEIVAGEPGTPLLRVSVEGGGCSGFSYKFDLVPASEPDDLVIARGNARVLVDPVSLEYLSGSEIDFVDDLIGSSFKVHNPNATASCGCGTSFSI
jgi:iron-sulfur cluster assembly accessory protein